MTPYRKADSGVYAIEADRFPGRKANLMLLQVPGPATRARRSAMDAEVVSKARARLVRLQAEAVAALEPFGARAAALREAAAFVAQRTS